MGITDKMVWNSAYYRTIDYPKFTDLYWKLLLGRVRTGEAWMDSELCPECAIPQTAEHLFWDCPTAKAIWEEMVEIINIITGVRIALPRNWGHLLAWGSYVQPKQGLDFERWRALFGEVLWSIWTLRCDWSFDEVEDFSRTRVMSRFLYKVQLRIQRTRLIGMHFGTKEDVAKVATTWGFDPYKGEDPQWLKDRMVQP